ncbi:MAG: class I SAM-dependent methyltransferase [Chloroflexota bacterium]
MGVPTTEVAVLQCADCSGSLAHGDAQSLHCANCARVYETDGPFLNLLPRRLESEKVAENTVFAPGSRELERARGRWWRSIVGRLDILRFADEILPALPVGRFLELGGETCYAAALYKAAHPDAVTYATDVSPNTLRFVASKVTPLFGATPDFFAAVDAEHLPFADGTIQVIFGQSLLHHLPHPDQALRECRRVLHPNGVAVFIDHSVPRHWRRLFTPAARQRTGEYGIQEKLYGVRHWRRIIRQAGGLTTELTFYRNPAYQRSPLFALGGELVQRLPLAIAVRFFPVGVMVVIRAVA